MAKSSLKAEWKLWGTIGGVILLVVLYLFMVSRPPMEGGEYLWRVTKVVDGTKFVLRGSGQTIEFSLVGLEVPPAQTQAARDLLERTVLDQWVRIKDLNDPSKGPREGFIYLSGEDLHALTIRQGIATVNRDEKRFDVRPYIELEMEAKRAKRGLWGSAAPGVK